MTAVASFVCLVVLQQLQVTPYPAEAGAEVTVHATASAGPLAGLAIAVRLPDGSERPLGVTGADGTLRCQWAEPGDYSYSADLDGVRLVTPHRITAAVARWPLAVVCVPLGLAFLWRNLPRKR